MWHQLPSIERKMINIKTQLLDLKSDKLYHKKIDGEHYKVKNMDNLTVGDVIRRVVQVAVTQSEMYQQDHKCVALLNKIATSDHKFNDINIKSIMSEDDYSEVKDKFE